MLFLRESVRWLAKKGRNDKALENLIWIRGGKDTEEVRLEFAEILASIENEIRASEGFTYKELLLPVNRLRIAIIVSMQLGTFGLRLQSQELTLIQGVQLTGNTSLAYYTPQIFSSLGAAHLASLLTGCFGIVKVLSCFLFVVSTLQFRQAEPD